MQFERHLLAIVLLVFTFQANSVEQRYVAVETAKIRDAPNGNITGKVHRGMRVDVHDQSGSWLRISSYEVAPRWIHSNLLCVTDGCWLHNRDAVPRTT